MAEIEESEINELRFEDALARRDAIVSRLEEGELTLEESLGLFEEGQSLAKRCSQLLEEAELKVESLTADGEIVELEVS
ncbi:MAG: exodeoxyribonuclease VII small subunit [Chloroflexota bacterium]|jgi:exodeoxyribonuclease VII small subunit